MRLTTVAPNVAFYKVDITSSENIRNVAEKIRAAHGEPTVLVNNAGVGHDGSILDEPEAKIRQTFEVNTISHFFMVREFLPSMVKRNHGHVITIASMASFVALGEMVDYCCSKASALAFHEGLSQELRYWYNAPKVRTRYVPFPAN
jgi:short-subunit dehydrogenase